MNQSVINDEFLNAKAYNLVMQFEDQNPEPLPVDQHGDEDTPASKQTPPVEIGGRKSGLDPTRYGDWEKNGRCIDF